MFVVTLQTINFFLLRLGVSLLLHYVSKLQPSCDHDVVRKSEEEFIDENAESESLVEITGLIPLKISTESTLLLCE